MAITKWLNYEFQTSSTTTEKFVDFFKDLKKYIKTNLPEGAELVNFTKNHFCGSGFVKKGDKYVYISISDVRFFKDEWYNKMLIRTAKHDKDFTGGANGFTDLPNLKKEIENMIE